MPNLRPAWTGLGLVLLVLASLLALELYFKHQEIDLKEHNRLSHQASVVASNFSHHLQASGNALDDVRKELPHIATQPGGKENASERMRHLVAAMTGVRSILLVDAEGNVLASNRKELLDLNFKDSERFQIIRRGSDPAKIYISPPFLTPLGIYSISIGKVILNKDGQFNGYVLAVLDPEYFTTVLNSAIYAPDVRAGLVHGAGKVVFRVPDPENLIGMDINAIPVPAFKKFVDAEQASVEFAEISFSEQSRRLLVYHLVKPVSTPLDFKLVVVLSRERSAMYASWMEEALVRLALFAIVTLTGIIGLLVYRRRQIAYALLQNSAEEERVRSNMELQESAEKFRQQSIHLEEIIWATDVGIWEWNIQTDTVVINERWATMFGYTIKELTALCGGHITKTALVQFADAEDIAHVHEKFERCFKRETDVFDAEIRMHHKQGHPIWVLTRARIVEWADDGSPLRMSGTNLDITTRKLSEEQIKYIAHHDLLTGLPNRVLLCDRIQQSISYNQRRKRSLAIAYLDLDGFKTINDHFGHEMGDQFLVALAKRLQESLRGVDTLARIGGDEFVALIVDLEQPLDCMPVLQRLLVAAAETTTVSDTALRVSASMGVTISPDDNGDPDQLLRHADQAMYLAKQAGKNRFHFFDIDQAHAIEYQHAKLEHIRAAIAKHEFVLYYQPKVNMRSGEVVGAEALIRWQHPENGLLPPSQFLPCLENHALSITLGEWVIDAALAQMSAWQSAGLAVSVSVNVSAYQILQSDFPSRLAQLLQMHPTVPAHKLELEILETSALEDIGRVSQIMHACSALGVHFALDDFGTGYSSLTYLKSLPADVLKIDQTFVRDILDDQDDLAIVEGVLGLARAFRRHAIAEGVETTAHGELLLALGCELAQGYAIARPMPAGDMPHWMATWRPDPSWESVHDLSRTVDEKIMVYADIKHRFWRRDIEDYVSGKKNHPPSLDTHLGRFDQWLKEDGQIRYGHLPDFHQVILAHEQIHALGRDLVAQYNTGFAESALEKLRELDRLHDQLIAKLRALLSSPQA